MNAMIYTRTAGPFSHAITEVSLPPDPWGTKTMRPDARPETAPPRGIKGAPTLTKAEATIAAIRACLEEQRAGA